jgi:hypothetical protein
MEEVRGRGELKRNAFVRLRRIFVDEEPQLEVEDFGSSDSLLKRRAHFETKARELAPFSLSDSLSADAARGPDQPWRGVGKGEENISL